MPLRGFHKRIAAELFLTCLASIINRFGDERTANQQSARQ
jgi:hypothetical protein